MFISSTSTSLFAPATRLESRKEVTEAVLNAICKSSLMPWLHYIIYMWKIISKLFQRIIAAHEYFPTCL